MHFREYLREKSIAIGLITFVIVTIEIFLMVYPFGLILKIYTPVCIYVSTMLFWGIDYHKRKVYYNNTLRNLEELEKKYLIAEIIKEPNFQEGKLLKRILEETDKSMIEEVNQYKYIQEDYQDYIELWIHEIKIPIATSKMVIENNKNPVTKSIEEELDKIENYIEQALYYARSNNVEKDYCIKKNKLEDIVKESIKKNKNMLIQEKIKINIHDIEISVRTDSKWITFILNQIIQNSIKYKKIEGENEIEIYTKEGKENIALIIKDKGIGIKEGEKEKVFQKGFTGTNGRETNKKSTGIGLYLCQKLCNKLGIGIELNSIQNEGTEVKLIFPQNSYIVI